MSLSPEPLSGDPLPGSDAIDAPETGDIVDFFDDPGFGAGAGPSGRVKDAGSPSGDDQGMLDYHCVRIVNQTGRALKIINVGYGSSASPGMATRGALVHAAQEMMHSDEGLALQLEGGVIADGEVWEQPINPLLHNPTFSTWLALARCDDALPAPAPVPPDSARGEPGSRTPPEVSQQSTVSIAVLALSNPMLGTRKINVGEAVMERWGHPEERPVPKAYREMEDGERKQVSIWGKSVYAHAELQDMSGAARWQFRLMSSDSVHKCLSFSVD